MVSCVLLPAGLRGGAPIDPKGPPAVPGARQRAILRRRVSEEPSDAQTKIAIFAMGRFWCAEPIFARLPGVLSTEVGYTGGWTEDPTYEKVLTESRAAPSGHAFAVRVGYDPGRITFRMLLEVFLEAHDPTPINRQGTDEGSQFRSAIFYDVNDPEELDVCMEMIEEERPINGEQVQTVMEARSHFYPAEACVARAHPALHTSACTLMPRPAGLVRCVQLCGW